MMDTWFLSRGTSGRVLDLLECHTTPSLKFTFYSHVCYAARAIKTGTVHIVVSKLLVIAETCTIVFGSGGALGWARYAVYCDYRKGELVPHPDDDDGDGDSWELADVQVECYIEVFASFLRDVNAIAERCCSWNIIILEDANGFLFWRCIIQKWLQSSPLQRLQNFVAARPGRCWRYRDSFPCHSEFWGDPYCSRTSWVWRHGGTCQHRFGCAPQHVSSQSEPQFELFDAEHTTSCVQTPWRTVCDSIQAVELHWARMAQQLVLLQGRFPDKASGSTASNVALLNARDVVADQSSLATDKRHFLDICCSGVSPNVPCAISICLCRRTGIPCKDVRSLRCFHNHILSAARTYSLSYTLKVKLSAESDWARYQ